MMMMMMMIMIMIDDDDDDNDDDDADICNGHFYPEDVQSAHKVECPK